MGAVLPWLVVGLLGALVGISELVARYRDAPGHAMRTQPAMVYVALNAIASVVALAVIRAFNWTFGVSGERAIEWTQALLAGFGAILLFRSSLFTVRTGGQDILIGPSNVLKGLLGATDRAVDRIRAQHRARAVARIMVGVSFEKAGIALPTHALALMQNLSEEDQIKFGHQVAQLREADMNENVKVLHLGLAIMSVLGEDVLSAAVTSLGDQIKNDKNADRARREPEVR